LLPKTCLATDIAANAFGHPAQNAMGDGLDQFLFGRAAVLGELQVEAELPGVPARGQRRDSDQAAFPR
jgi:hypothetical protein